MSRYLYFVTYLPENGHMNGRNMYVYNILLYIYVLLLVSISYLTTQFTDMDHLKLTLFGSNSKSPKCLRQGWANPGGQVDQATEVFTDSHNICGSPVWKLLCRTIKYKSKTIMVQHCYMSRGSQEIEAPRFRDSEEGKVVSPRHRPHLPSRKYS